MPRATRKTSLQVLKDLKRHRLTLDNAGETLSDARMASEGPRATEKLRPGGLSYQGHRLHRDRDGAPTDL